MCVCVSVCGVIDSECCAVASAVCVCLFLLAIVRVCAIDEIYKIPIIDDAHSINFAYSLYRDLY